MSKSEVKRVVDVLESVKAIVESTALVALSGGAFIFAVKVIQALIALL